ncbi:Carboxypeptidase regulatory-like domain-containing protein [Singulisphaera sp. GP187]|uniref:carboxypeptidase regulatory-like domain-containing protein n=1 Tax=Singulisphaera sp. GP187 TaxID=1882752 RepID=UPI00092B686E|nr:carboxypeptidase regulatory-like domain-containing protein [Singulisphaera sp. GP187]SIO58624.1 Carboxypeptidase regulatory-like domain-containing protein [Singulisphaera sp. GP187]
MWDRRRRAVRMVCLGALFLFLSPGGAEAGRVRGTVVDRAGKPAAGALVWAAKLSFLEARETQEATADGSGAFDIEVGPGDWLVFALRGDEGGRGGWGSIAKVGDGKDPAPVAIRLGAPTRFKGRLLDAETGDPVTQGRFALDDARLLEVDAQGRFEAPGLDLTNHEAYPLCPGFERKRILFDTTGRPDAELELRLPKAGKIVGRVLDEDGKPIAGASVGLRTSGSIFSGSALWEKCSADGRYSYDGKPFGRTGRLAARAPGYQDQEREDVVALDAAVPTEINFTLRPDPRKGSTATAKTVAKALNRRTVSGTIVDSDRKPVAGAVVRWDLLVSSDSVPETNSDAEGAFRLENVPDAANVLSVMAKGLAPAFPPVESGGDLQVTVELKRGVTIRGRVVDEEGKPIEGVRVVPQIDNPKPNWAGFVYLDTLQAETDRDGKFTLEGMPENVRCDVVAEGRSAARQRPLSPSDESKNEVVLLGGGAIRGRVVDPLGNPVKNFRVQVGIPKNAKPGDPVGGYFAGYGGTGLAFTRNDGEFTISGLTAGNIHRLTVIAENFGAGVAERVESQSLGRLKPADDLTIRLGVGHTLRVRVIREKGKVVEGARVTIIQNEGRGGFQWGYSDSSWDDSVTAQANAMGWAEFPNLAFGKGTVVVRAKGFSRTRLEWVNDEEEVDIFVEPESRLAGTVLDESGKPVSGSRIMLSWGNGEMMNILVDEKDGRFLADELGSGKYSLNVIPSAGPALYSGSVDLEPGKTVTEEIRVKRPTPAAARERK